MASLTIQGVVVSCLQSLAQCQVLFPGSSSSLKMLGPPVRPLKCIRRDHKERSASCCQRGMKNEVEKLWYEFFSNPSEWQDHRLAKMNPRFPDFQHQQTQQSLWLNSKWIPPWVEAKLAAMAPGIAKSSNVAWNQRLSRYAKAGQHKKIMELYEQMQRDGIHATGFTFCPVLSACASLGALEEGRHIHMHITQNGLESDLFVGTSLIDMYTKCGSREDAERVFNHMHTRSVVTWNAMILGCVKCGHGQHALELYEQMQQEQMDPDPGTFMAVLAACTSVAALGEGRCVHEEIIQRGYATDTQLSTCLVDMYGKCGSIDEAKRVFNQMCTRDVVTWTAMIVGYVKCGEGQQALELYRQMQWEGVDPDPVVFMAVLKACASVAALAEGRAIHEEIIRKGYATIVHLANSLIDMYCKCRRIEEAERVFNQMITRDVVTWNAMILGKVKCGEGQQALDLYRQMQQEGADPNPVTFVAVLNACASVAVLEQGRIVHEDIIRRGYETDVCVSNTLIDMYDKCGSIENAERVFKHMPTRDVVGWNAIIAAYGRHGYPTVAIEHFKQMCEVVEVDGVTFICLLTSCSHGGLVDDGLKYFESMSAVHNISPKVEHYACVVDLLCRTKRLCEAEDLVMTMPMDPSVTVWMSLLSACRAHANVEVGERCARRLLELDPENSAGYVLLADINIAAGKWKSSTSISQERFGRSLEMGTGCTYVGDCAYLESMEICTEPARLSAKVKAPIRSQG